MQPPIAMNAQALLAFGPFVLDRGAKLLMEGGRPVRLGSRALQLLIALVERAGQVVSRNQLEACVWPDTVVEETSLRVHISALRKALGEAQDKDGVRYIANVVGRGYSFVAPVRTVQSPLPVAGAPLGVSAAAAGSVPPRHNLPNRLSRMIGRAAAQAELAALLAQRRLVTIVGPGGMGKTSLALAVAEACHAAYPQGARFVDLAPLSAPELVPAALAAALSLAVPAHDPLPALCAFLAGSRMLIVLDNCEHVIDAAALLAERLLAATTEVRILATSRAALDVSGEAVYRLAALALPPKLPNLPVHAPHGAPGHPLNHGSIHEPGDESTHELSHELIHEPSHGLSLEQALASPAVQLFAERAMANADSFALSDANLAPVLQICRRLDGIPLAIELAAARVDSLGVHGLAARIDDLFRLLTRGRRSVLPRHRTLQALFDWSYDLLSEDERALLQRLAIFRAGFSSASAACVAACEGFDAGIVAETLASLASQSLVAVDVGGEAIAYRLLHTTRRYAEQRLAASGEARAVAARHAHHVHDLLARAGADLALLEHEPWKARHGALIDDARAALEWAFSDQGEALLAVQLTVAALPSMAELSLLDEHRATARKAAAILAGLPEAGAELEVRLLTTQCFTSSQGQDPADAQRALVQRTEQMALACSQPELVIEALYSICVASIGHGNYAALDAAAQRLGAMAAHPDEPMAVLLADRFRTLSSHYMGRHQQTRALAERVLGYRINQPYRQYLGQVPRQVSIRIVLSRTLWLSGEADQASRVVREGLDYADGAHPFALSQMLAAAALPIALWRGDDAQAQALLQRLSEHAQRYSLSNWMSWVASYRRVLLLRAAGHALAAQSGPAPTKATELDMLSTLDPSFVSDAVLRRAEQGGVAWCAAEILRAYGEQTLSGRGFGTEAAMGAKNRTENQTKNETKNQTNTGAAAEALFVRALELARSQQALAWELRSAASLARLWAGQGRAGAAHALLSEVLLRFREGHGTADLTMAQALLCRLRDQAAASSSAHTSTPVPHG